MGEPVESDLRCSWQLVLCWPVPAGNQEVLGQAKQLCAGGRLQQERREERLHQDDREAEKGRRQRRLVSAALRGGQIEQCRFFACNVDTCAFLRSVSRAWG